MEMDELNDNGNAAVTPPWPIDHLVPLLLLLLLLLHFLVVATSAGWKGRGKGGRGVASTGGAKFEFCRVNWTILLANELELGKQTHGRVALDVFNKVLVSLLRIYAKFGGFGGFCGVSPLGGDHRCLLSITFYGKFNEFGIQLLVTDILDLELSF